MTSKEGPKLSYLNLRIIQSPYGIRIGQIYHIQDTILAKCFPGAFEKVKPAPNPFKANNTFELTIVETLPDTPTELHVIEDCCLGKFSAHTGKILHIMQYTRPDLMYSVKSLLRHASDT